MQTPGGNNTPGITAEDLKKGGFRAQTFQRSMGGATPRGNLISGISTPNGT